MLVNAISHERLSPLNTIIPTTEQITFDLKNLIVESLID